jgi:hypothetical protein
MDFGLVLSSVWTAALEVGGLVALGTLGTLLAATFWVRLLWGQPLPGLLIQSVLTHSPVLIALAWFAGFDLPGLVAWDASIFAACYISYCAYFASVWAAESLASPGASRLRFSGAGYSGSAENWSYRAWWAAGLLAAFLEYMVFRALYTPERENAGRA